MIIRDAVVPICMVGFMCTGKTSVGRLLAKKLGSPFFDLDEEIEKTLKLSVSQIFKNHGEKFFREQETRYLENILNSTCNGCIISTGGGCVVSASNRRILKARTFCIFLNPPWETIEVRLQTDYINRPLLKNTSSSQIKALWENRLKFYREVARIVVCEDDSQENISDNLLKRLRDMAGDERRL